MKRPSMKVRGTIPKSFAWSIRLLPIAVGGLAMLGLVVACGKQGGGKELISRGHTPPVLGKLSARKYFSRADDAELAARLMGVSATAIPDGVEGKEFAVTVSFLVGDPSNASLARKVVAEGSVLPGKAQAPAPAAPGAAAAPIPAAAPVTAPAPSRASRSTKAQGGEHNLSEIETDQMVADTAAAAAAPKSEGLPGQRLDLNLQKSSKGLTNDHYAIQAVCDDPKCNNLYVLLAEASQQKKLTIRLVFSRTTPEGVYRIIACPADPGDTVQATANLTGNQRFALRSRRSAALNNLNGNSASNSVGNSAAGPAGAKCQEISSFEAALKEAEQNQTKTVNSALEPDKAPANPLDTDGKDPQATEISTENSTEKMLSEDEAAKLQTTSDGAGPVTENKK